MRIMGEMGTQLRFKGEFEYQGLYTLWKEFFTSRGYDFYENRYKDKGDEFEVEWKCERDYDEMHKMIFEVKFHAWDADKLQVEKQGKPVMLVKARILINFSAKLSVGDSDLSGAKVFENNDSIFKKIYDKINERSIDEYWDVTMGMLLVDLSSQTKSYLGMQG